MNSQQRKTTHHWPSVSSNHRWSGITNHWHLGTLAQAQHVFWDGVSKCYASLAQHNDALQVERYDEPLALRVTNHRDTCLVCLTLGTLGTSAVNSQYVSVNSQLEV